MSSTIVSGSFSLIRTDNSLSEMLKGKSTVLYLASCISRSGLIGGCSFSFYFLSAGMALNLSGLDPSI
jgi:hypothetical protein